jgi:replicative DNA helicase
MTERDFSAIGKAPPQNLEAEQSTLGSMMLEPAALEKGLEMLVADDFYRPAHQEIFDALLTLSDKNEPVDIITLQEELRRRDKLDDCGGVEYLIALVETVPTASNVEHYAKIVEQKSVLRKLISAGRQIIELGNEEEAEVDTQVDRATGIMLGISRKTENGMHSFDESVNAAWDRLEAYHSQEGFMGIPFGIPKLDRMLSGVKESGLYIIGGRPSNGKTVLAMDLAINAAEGKKHVGIFSQETSHAALTERAIIKRAGVDSTKFKHKAWSPNREENDDLHKEAWSKLGVAAQELRDLKNYITIWDKSTDINGLIRTIKREHMRKKLGLVVIDYLQLIEYRGKAENRNVELTYVCKALRNCAQDLGFPIVAAAQLRRLEEKTSQKPTSDDSKIIRGVYPPTVNALREGGNQEAEAYAIILLHNPPDDRPEDEQTTPRFCYAILAKHKDGPTGWIPLWFDGSTYTFREQSEREINGDYANPFNRHAATTR